jgi:hypothetical protein
MAVYIPLGHGSEDVTRPRDVVPEGCSVTVIETPGGLHYWTSSNTEEIFEYTQITNFLRDHADRKGIFSNPKENAKEIIDIFGSVAIFGPGEKYPNIEYDLLLSWDVDSAYSDIRYSGLIPFDTFLSREFTTKNIISKLPNSDFSLYNSFIYEDNNKWLNNNLEIYKYSIYPSPADFTRYFSSIDGRKQLYIDKGMPEKAEQIDENTIKIWDADAKAEFNGTRNKGEGYTRVSLKTLMEKFPGNYIHLVCRASWEGRRGDRRRNVGSPWAKQLHTQEEVFTKRIPLMTANQKRQAIEHIEQSRRNKVKSRFNLYSTKNTSNIMLAGLKRSLVQNQIKNASHPIKLKPASERPNETRKNKVEYTGRKWAIGGRTTRKKLHKSKSHRAIKS